MPEDERDAINSPFGLNIANFIGKRTPYPLGHRIAVFAADFISARKSWKMVSATRSNQWVISGERLDEAALDNVVRANFRNIAMSIYDYYYYQNNPGASLRKIVPHPTGLQLVRRPLFAERGVVIAGIHMSNFDMAFQIGGLAGIKALVITLSELNEAYKKQWEMRGKSGLSFVTASFGSMKTAVNYLRKGGMIITAIDRPDQNSAYRPRFFGHPAAMPIHHIFLALKAHVPIILGAIYKEADSLYYFLFSDPIEMDPYPDRHQEIVLNAEKVLSKVEDIIRRAPTQWSMTFPIWPEITPPMKNRG